MIYKGQKKSAFKNYSPFCYVQDRYFQHSLLIPGMVLESTLVFYWRLVHCGDIEAELLWKSLLKLMVVLKHPVCLCLYLFRGKFMGKPQFILVLHHLSFSPARPRMRVLNLEMVLEISNPLIHKESCPSLICVWFNQATKMCYPLLHKITHICTYRFYLPLVFASLCICFSL